MKKLFLLTAGMLLLATTASAQELKKVYNEDINPLEQVAEAGWKLENVTYDLHHSEYVTGNVMTEYEEKFTAKGNPICRLVAYREH